MMNVMIADDSDIFRERFLLSVSSITGISSITQASNTDDADNLFENKHAEIVI
jgi:YesN/AraC family two-component response regulator